MFGFDLFGRPPIQLPDDDVDDALSFLRHCRGSGSTSTPTPTTTLTTQTFDSDATQLDISTIQKISVSKATEVEATSLKEREDRRQWRNARKEMRRLVEAAVVDDGEELKGFQRSGGLALVKRPSGARDYGYVFVGISFSVWLSIPAIQRRFGEICIRPS